MELEVPRSAVFGTGTSESRSERDMGKATNSLPAILHPCINFTCWDTVGKESLEKEIWSLEIKYRSLFQVTCNQYPVSDAPLACLEIYQLRNRSRSIDISSLQHLFSSSVK
jgi:hypothetical protein